MIVDTHCHIWGMRTKFWWDSFVKASAEASGRPEEYVREKVPGWSDVTGDLLVQDMDEAGIDKAVILTVDRALEWGISGEPSVEGEVVCLEGLHKMIAKAVERHPTRLIAFAGVDPRRPRAVEFLERAVKEWDMKGLKLHPALGFYPNDRLCYKLYMKCEELGLPVVLHTGPEEIPLYSKYASPIYLDEVANDFPELKIILGHSGGCYWPEAAAIASNKPNIFLDLAWWQTRLLRHPIENFYKPLRSLIDIAGSSKIMFGSDWPALRQVRRMSHVPWLKAFKEIPDEVKAAGVEFTEQEINRILGENAVKVLGL